MKKTSMKKDIETGLADLVNEFLSECKEKKTCGSQSPSSCCDDTERLENILDCICGARNTDENRRTRKFKKNVHQYRMPAATILDAEDKFKANEKELKKCRNFNDLHDLVKKLGKDIKQFGPLATYDFSLRYGGLLGIEPDMLYLHAGTYEGAKYLVELGIFDKNILKQKDNDIIRVSMDQLRKSPGYLSCLDRLTPELMEVFLCVKKDKIKKLNETIK